MGKVANQTEVVNQEVVERKVRRRRLLTVTGNMIMMASHVTGHSRQLAIGLGRSNTGCFAFRGVYTAFADFYA